MKSQGKIPPRKTCEYWNSDLKILIRNGDGWLGEQLASGLGSDGHLTMPVPYSTTIGHDESTDALVGGHDALVVFGYVDSMESTGPSAVIDH